MVFSSVPFVFPSRSIVEYTISDFNEKWRCSTAMDETALALSRLASTCELNADAAKLPVIFLIAF
jgi:hypothetical protein